MAGCRVVPYEMGIETAYETLKDRLQMENFTGTKPALCQQDIYSTIYVRNLAEDIIRDAVEELDEKENNRKHKMAINQTVISHSVEASETYKAVEKGTYV